jgi:2-polyprenyl-3-methyl-5-hydroxy-6-metoxy-1,4-benzoquinol methylase
MMENALYDMLRSKYQIGNHFIAAYLLRMLGSDDVGMDAFQQKLASNSNLANWADYALSSNMRGREFAKVLRPHFPKGARRYLDVGSAYGGFLIGFMELDLEVKGIEFSQDLVELSQANFKDYGMEDVSIKGDILDNELMGQLGKFDIITCIDVIEHVNDVPQAMKNMAGLLNPGGILVLQMPNKNSVSNVMADSHFNVFGITLLKHSDARRFYFCNFPNSTLYDVGEYYQQEYYLKLLTDLGCQSSTLPSLSPTKLSEKVRLIPKFYSRLGFFLFRNPVAIPTKT